jgi:hypothetical protein
MLYPYTFTQVAGPLIPRTNSKLFVDNVAECSNPNIFTQGCWSCPFPPSQIGDDGDNGAQTDDGGVVGQAAKIPLGYLAHLDRISIVMVVSSFLTSFMAGRRGQNCLKYHCDK